MLQREGQFPIDSFIGIFIGHLFYYFEKVHPNNGGNSLLYKPIWFKELFEIKEKQNKTKGTGKRLGK